MCYYINSDLLYEKVIILLALASVKVQNKYYVKCEIIFCQYCEDLGYKTSNGYQYEKISMSVIMKFPKSYSYGKVF